MKDSNKAIIVFSIVAVVFAFALFASTKVSTTGYAAKRQCMDSDGTDPYTWGYVTSSLGQRYYDTCISRDKLKEYYCEYNSVKFITVNCTYGCSAGRCSSPCVPNCNLKCGGTSNGCGGSCSTSCPSDYSCISGKCVQNCADNCEPGHKICNGRYGYQYCQESPTGCYEYSDTFNCPGGTHCCYGDCIYGTCWS